MSEASAKTLELASQDGLITRDTFAKLEMWFDEVEVSEDREYSIPFERLIMIKETLFDINSTTVEGRDEPVVKVADLISILREPAMSVPHK